MWEDDVISSRTGKITYRVKEKNGNTKCIERKGLLKKNVRNYGRSYPSTV